MSELNYPKILETFSFAFETFRPAMHRFLVNKDSTVRHSTLGQTFADVYLRSRSVFASRACKIPKIKRSCFFSERASY